ALADYADLLLWLGGQSFTCGSAATATDACHWDPVLHPAHVINLSHGLPSSGSPAPARVARGGAERGRVPAPVVQVPNTPQQAAPALLLPDTIGMAYEKLTKDGRDGKGI